MTGAVADRDEILSSRVVIPDNVVLRAFEAETLLLNLDTGTYHGLNQTGARMLDLLRETDGDVGRSLETLSQEYDMPQDELAEDLVRLCRELVDRGLLELVPR
ncbi:MAG: PqqD family protein [Actinobacteria bacterium]|nr:MAG: PqqD family protein [Actinomycetota bacterium]